MVPITSGMTVTTRTVAALAAGVVLAGCAGGGSSVAYTFNRSQPSCRVHQKKLPDSSYTQAATSLTSFSLNQAGFLQDYTPHADQPFCDGARANPDDVAWAALYTRLKATLPGAASSDLDRPDLTDPDSPAAP